MKLSKASSVHAICTGLFMQESLILEPGLYVVPLEPLGFGSAIEATIRYARNVCGVEVDAACREGLYRSTLDAIPTLAIVSVVENQAASEELERLAKPKIDQALQALSWASGDPATIVSYLISNEGTSFIRMVPPHSRKRQRLGFGNTGADFYGQLHRMRECASKDEHFGYALALFKDAQGEPNELFKVARMYTVLECLAQDVLSYIRKQPINKEWHDKKGSDLGSRTAVRVMLDLDNGAMVEWSADGKSHRFDVIEVAGRIRDDLYHGNRTDPESQKKEEYRELWRFIMTNLNLVANSLDSYCNLALARWANNASKGRDAREGKPIEVNIVL